MLFLAFQAIYGTLEHIHLQFHLCVLLLSVLHLVAVQIERILDLLSLDIVLFQLAAFDPELTLR